MTWLKDLSWQEVGRNVVALFWIAVFFFLLFNAGNDGGQYATIFGLILFVMGLMVGMKHHIKH